MNNHLFFFIIPIYRWQGPGIAIMMLIPGPLSTSQTHKVVLSDLFLGDGFAHTQAQPFEHLENAVAEPNRVNQVEHQEKN